MKGRALRPFPYAADGIRVEQLAAGDERDFAADIMPGLVAEGLVAPVRPLAAPENAAHAGAPETAESGRRPRRGRASEPPTS